MDAGAYWKLVFGTALKAAWRDGPWSTWLKAICAILAAAVGVGVVHLVKKDWAYTSIATPVAIITVVLLAVLYYVWKVAPEIYAAQKAAISALEERLSTYNPPAPDMLVLDAVKWIATQFPQPALPYELQWAAIGKIREAAHDGRLTVWGRPFNYGALHVPIPADWWTVGQIDLTTLNASPPGVDTKRVGSQSPAQYFDLKVRQVEIEREWPATPKP